MNRSTAARARNLLADETSPYLLQHADNPVHWRPWDEAALAEARRENKPILLSIGYSACHWCHVMAHESFENEATAAVMNEHFVNIKVDREERPDLDRIYQTAHQILTRRPGGWPLTLFLTPDGRLPFYAGTYFPPTPRHGLPAFTELLRGVAEAYRTRGEAVVEQTDHVQRVLTALESATPAGEPTAAPLDEAVDELLAQHDRVYGGFGGAPKFPHPTSIERLLVSGRDEAREAARFTLRRMALGGLYDQLAGGFYRYSVDERWEIPHFEKMLYDNGQLLALYARAAVEFDDPLLRRVAEETGHWAIDEMQSPQGGFWSTLDADSGGMEGGYYTWRLKEVEEALPERELAVIAEWYRLGLPPNFEGRWHLHAEEGLEAVASRLGISPQEAGWHAASGREKLLARRRERPLPGRDEKILASWNGLMIGGLAVAGRELGIDAFIDAAERAVAFLRREMWREGRLFATWKGGQARHAGYLDDYAYLLDALLELLRARWRDHHLSLAVELADALLTHFEDHDRGGFYFTADDHEALIQRPKPWSDEAIPAGNGVAARALGRLGRLLGEPRYLEAARRTLHAAWGAVEATPHAHGALLAALDEWLVPPSQVIVRAPAGELASWSDSRHYPGAHLYPIPDDASLPEALADRAPRPGGVAYLCEGTACQPPIHTPEALRRAL